MVIHNPILTGSFTVNNIDVSSITSSAANITALNATTASLNAFSASVLSYTASQNILNGTYTLTSSFAAQTASFTAFTSSINAFSASILAQTASLNSFSASVLSYTSSLNNKTSSFATTGSNTFIGTQTITGSVLQSGSFTSTGTLTAQTLVVQTITSSVVYSSGSNIFGNALNNTQTFTGSVLVTGSLTIAGGSSATSYSGATIYGSTAVCSPVGKFTTCIDAGYLSSIISSSSNASPLILQNTAGWASSQITSISVKDASSAVGAIGWKYDGAGNVDMLFHSLYNGAYKTTSDIVMTVKGTGNVGIGTSSPSDNLHIVACEAGNVGVTVQNTNSSYSSQLRFLNSTGTEKAAVTFVQSTTSLNLNVNQIDALIISSTGTTTFAYQVCAAGHVSSEDVRIYRSAGTTTGYINFGSTGTNYLGFDGTRFSINGSINATGATFSDVSDTCLVLRTTNSGNPRFKFCGGAGVFNRSAASDIMYFGESSDTGLYLFRGGTLMSDKGACTSTYGFTHCGASRWGRFGMPNASYMYLETNADTGFYIDGQTRVAGYFCASGNIQGAHLKMANSICASGVRLGQGSFNTGYTSDGIYGATATPSYIVGSGYNSGFYLGYVDNGSGLYGAAYAFNVKCTHGGGGSGTAEYDAIRMRNDESGVVPFRLTNWGNLYATSKNFRINHPIPSMNNTHHLIHTAIEGPQADLIYRGKVELVNGKAEVNIDESSRMTIGTFELLCQNVQSYTTNESGWALIKSYVVGNILHIEAQDETITDTISWLVIGERKDDGMKNSNITDNDCHLVVETLIPELELES